MAESKPIQHDDIIAPNIFKTDIEQAIVLEGELTKIISGFKELAIITGKKIRTIYPKTITDVQQLAEAEKQLTTILSGSDQAHKQLLITQAKVAALKSQEKKDAKEIALDQLGLTTQYQKQSKALDDLRKRYSELELAGRKSGVVARGLLQTIQEQDKHFKELDASVGKHTRNVGNYAEALKGVSAVGIALGEVMGIDAEKIRALQEAHGILRHSIMGTKEILHNLTGEHHAAGDAVSQEGAEVKKLTIFQKAYNSIVGESTGFVKYFKLALAGIGIGLVIAGIIELAKFLFDMGKATESAADKVSRLKKELEEQAEIGVINNETLKEYKEATEASEAAQQLLEKSIGDANEELKKQKELLEEINDFGRKKLSTEDVATRATTGMGLAKVTIVELHDALQDLQKEESKFTLDKAKKAFEDFSKAGKPVEGLSKEQMAALSKEAYNLDGSLEAVTERYKEEGKEIQKTITLIEKELERRDPKKQKELSDKLAEQWKKYWKELWEYELKGLDDKIKKAQELYEKEGKEFIKNIEEKQKAIDAFYKNLYALERANELKTAQLNKDREGEENIIYKRKLEDLKSQYLTEKQNIENVIKLQSTSLKQKLILLESESTLKKQYQKAEQLLEQEHQQTLRGIRLQNEVTVMEQSIKGAKDGMAKRNELELESIRNRGDMANTEIQVQAALAAAGKKNILDFELKEKAKALDQELQLKRKAQHQEEGLQLASLFLEEMKVYAKDGPGAAAKALQQTLLGKGIAAGFTAIFAEDGVKLGEKGKETTLGANGWSQSHKGGKDILVLGEPGERMLSKNDTNIFESLGGLAMLRNPGEYFGTTIVNDFSNLDKRLESLEKTIRDKRELYISKNLQGELVLKESENGTSVTTVKKSYPIIPYRPT